MHTHILICIGIPTNGRQAGDLKKMVTLVWIAGIIVILIGLAFLGWALYDVVIGGVSSTAEVVVAVIVGIALVLVGAWLTKGGGISISTH
jgi:hypothetical protein